MTSKARRIAALAAMLWLGGAAVALGALARYKATPGQAVEIARRWPDAVRIDRNADRPTLVMFAHPKCACTRASLGELRTVMSEHGRQVDAYVVFLVPKNEDDWRASDIHRDAESIPNVRVIDDLDGRIANAFGAVTSGHVVLYDPNGALLFEGGITGARGHAGDNAGRARLSLAIVERTSGAHPVFGCSMKEGLPP